MSLFCRASSTVATLPFRTARSSPASHQTGAQRVTLGGSHHFSRASSLISSSTASKLSAITPDENLVSILDSEIKSSFVKEEAPRYRYKYEDEYEYEYEEEEEEDKLPEGFPFQVLDTPGERNVWLRRKFEDEIILIKFDIPAPKDPQDGEEEVPICIPMDVDVYRDEDGVGLEFGLKAYVDKIVINNVYVQQPNEPKYPYQGPVFDDLDENLKKAFHRYLEIRGITHTITDFLADYLANKGKREHLLWLKDVKSFVDM